MSSARLVRALPVILLLCLLVSMVTATGLGPVTVSPEVTARIVFGHLLAPLPGHGPGLPGGASGTAARRQSAAEALL